MADVMVARMAVCSVVKTVVTSAVQLAALLVDLWVVLRADN